MKFIACILVTAEESFFPRIFDKCKDLTLIWIQWINLSGMRFSDRLPLPLSLLKFKSKRGVRAVGSSLSSCACCRVIITETPIYTPAIWHCFLSLEVPKTARGAVAEELSVVVGIRKLPSARYCGTVLRSNLQAE